MFRHEPSEDPARRQIFRMHEIVRIAGREEITAWRREWIERGTAFLPDLGLEVELDVANDPFFGRGGAFMAADQRVQELKLEFLCAITDGPRTAIASSNDHQDHFGLHWGLRLADGEIAHTSCLAFGHDRIAVALLQRHGFEPADWPESVRAILEM